MFLSIENTCFESFCRQLADAASRGYELRRVRIRKRWFRSPEYTAELRAPAGFDLVIGPFEAL